MNSSLYRRFTAIVVVVVFAITSIPIAAGAHFDVSFEHKFENNEHGHASQFHLSEFEDPEGSMPIVAQNAEQQIKEYTNGQCGYQSEHSRHIHSAENNYLKKQYQSVAITQYRLFSFLSAIPSITVSTDFQYRTQTATFFIRGPPVSIV